MACEHATHLMKQVSTGLIRSLQTVFDVVYGVYVVLAFLVLGAIAFLLVTLVPGLSISARRAIAHAGARTFFAAALVRVRVTGTEQLPAGPCVVVANHASYLDGVLLKAFLPARFSFVIKKEVVKVPDRRLAVAAYRFGVRGSFQSQRRRRRRPSLDQSGRCRPGARILPRRHFQSGAGPRQIPHRRLRDCSARGNADRPHRNSRHAPHAAQRAGAAAVWPAARGDSSGHRSAPDGRHLPQRPGRYAIGRALPF